MFPERYAGHMNLQQPEELTIKEVLPDKAKAIPQVTINLE